MLKRIGWIAFVLYGGACVLTAIEDTFNSNTAGAVLYGAGGVAILIIFWYRKVRARTEDET